MKIIDWTNSVFSNSFASWLKMYCIYARYSLRLQRNLCVVNSGVLRLIFNSFYRQVDSFPRRILRHNPKTSDINFQRTRAGTADFRFTKRGYRRS